MTTNKQLTEIFTKIRALQDIEKNIQVIKFILINKVINDENDKKEIIQLMKEVENIIKKNIENDKTRIKINKIIIKDIHDLEKFGII